MTTKLAGAALAMGILAFVNMFGLEKAAAAIIFGVIALKDPAIELKGKRLAKAAIIVGIAYLAVLAGIIVYHMPAINAMASKLAK